MTMQVKGKVYIVGLAALILFGIFTLNLYAQHDLTDRTRSIRVTIIDANGPVHNATLRIVGGNGELSSIDSSNVIETSQLYKNRTYTIIISHPNYQTYQDNIYLPDGCGSFSTTVTMIE